MPQIKWSKSLVRGTERRRTFTSWQIPQDIRSAHDIRDGDYLDATVHFGRRQVRGSFLVTSGGELSVRTRIAADIQKYALQASARTISFSMEDFLTAVVDPDEGSDVPETERAALIAARIGQGNFRDDLMRIYENRCAVTNVDVPALLRASHIKPWSKSSNAERLDPENGILLVATLDAAFDAILISFGDDGSMLFHPQLGPDPTATLGIRQGSRLTRAPSTKQGSFLGSHRESARLE
ncbi:HNH endonuclease [Lichenicoccus sp.]|uniref:HNH endonuclease n=1 Tax=Lichenicoccus sp. TaxID=2781899 RepID=UPI003D0F9584